MSKTVKYYPVREFQVIRINCAHMGCRVTLEMAPAQVEAALKKTGGCCPLCNKPFTRPDVEGGADVVTALAKAVLALDKLGGNVQVEFPVVAAPESAGQ